MALTKWRPFGGLKRFLDDDISRWPLKDIEDYFDGDYKALSFPKFSLDLACDIYEKNGNVIAEMNAPGIDPDKIDITVEDGYLKVSGSREECKETEEKDYYSKEIKRGYLERVLPLPTAVKRDKAEAEYKNGILKITIPKEESKNGTVKVKVKQ